MPPISFQSDIKDNIIKIPEQYRQVLSPQVLVTLVPLNQPQQKKISPPHIQTKDWKFSRDEANER